MPSLEIWRIADGKIVEHWGGLQVSAHTMRRLRND
jgi:predicted SnoaL-like aldol condensation-catalyzing enzyme